MKSPDPVRIAELAAYMRTMAERQRELAVEFDQFAEAMERRADPSRVPADGGHTFRLNVECRGSSAVVGDEHHHDESGFSMLPSSVEVRAWNLADALKRASGLPLSAWFPEEGS
jgi:hypothetical protein